MAHRWRFVRAGGFDQVVIDSGADLEALPTLDQKLWVALACPTKGIEFDERTLALLDTDKDGRVQAPEVIAAVKWACEMTADPDDLVKGRDGMPLSAIDTETDEGKRLLSTAKTLLASIDETAAKKMTVDAVTRAAAGFAKQPFNGDGVIPVSAVSEEAVKAQIRDVLACTASPPTDRGGDPGIDKATLDKFFEAIDAYQSWKGKGTDASLRPLGDDTAAAFAALGAVRTKIDDYFARARVAAYDARALVALNGDEKSYLEIAQKNLEATSAEIERMPIAQIAADKPLPLTRGVSPAWTARLAELRKRVIEPKLGATKDTLTEAEWTTLVALFAEHAKWTEAKAAAAIEKLLGAERIATLAAPEVRASLAALVAKDAEKAEEAKAIESVEKLVRYHRDLIGFVNNFVCFRDFYARTGLATFQSGTLYLDQRACELVLRVNDAGKHASMAPLSNSYLLYCDCKNAKGESMQIAAAVTAGDVDNLMVGRNGLFYDRKGASWDATIAKIVDNPISVRQAFWSPYKKVLRMIEEQIAKRASDAAAAQDTALAGHVDATHAAVAAGGPPPAPIPARRFDIGTVAALGVAVGGITAAFGALLSGFFGLGLWMPLGILGLILCISGPSMAIAWLKLHKRNLGPILDANGWAVNAQARINVPLGGSLTKVAELPKGSSLSLTDPFAEKQRPWGLYVTFAIVLALGGGYLARGLDGWLPRAWAAAHVVYGEPLHASAQRGVDAHAD